MVSLQHDISAPLLRYLQKAFDVSSLRYKVPPTPLSGGYSSQLFKFQLDTLGALAVPLVIRLYTSSVFPPGQAFIEGEIQNLVFSEGYPVPPVHSICEDATILGHEFIIMRFMPGEMMIKAYPFENVPAALANAHAQLRAFDMDTITNKLESKGFFARQHLGLFTSSFPMFIDNLESQIALRKLTPLVPALEWIQDHQSITGHHIVINHGDFHPLNILIDHGEISAVLDWQAWCLGEPEFDVTNTMVKLHCLASVLLPQYNWSVLIKRYVADYHNRHTLDYEKLRFYQAVWCLRLYLVVTGGLPNLNHPQIRRRLLDQFTAITGITLAVS
jgi:aminoglycoside phosphotransferase (APT) family kinase protein